MTRVVRLAAALATALSIAGAQGEDARSAPSAVPAAGRVIEFELNGLHYYTQSRGDITVMFAHLPQQMPNYFIIEVSVLNGSKSRFDVRPESFRFRRANGAVVQALSANTVVAQFLERGSRNDVVKLVQAYEAALYGFQRGRATNGYEQRRQAAMADAGPTRFNAAAMASALVLIPMSLKAGESTDGAVFFPVESGKALGKGQIVVATPAGEFSFDTTLPETPQ